MVKIELSRTTINAIQMNGLIGAALPKSCANSFRRKIRGRLRKGLQRQPQLSKIFSSAMSPFKHGQCNRRNALKRQNKFSAAVKKAAQLSWPTVCPLQCGCTRGIEKL